MRPRSPILLACALTLNVALSTGCHDWASLEPLPEGGEGTLDAEIDGGADAGLDAALDAGLDASRDAGPGAPDGGLDAGFCATSCDPVDELCTGDDRARGCCNGLCVPQESRLLGLAHGRPEGSTEAMVIDGLATEWSGVPEHFLTRWTADGASCPAAANLRAWFQVQWDLAGLYVLVTVRDNVRGRHAGNLHEDDAVELLVHLDGVPVASAYGGHGFHVLKRAAPSDPPQILDNGGDPTRIEVASADEGNLYRVELAIGWAELLPYEGMVFGFDVAVDDDDLQGDRGRERRHVWSDMSRASSMAESVGDARNLGLLRISGPLDRFPRESLLCPSQCELREAGYCSVPCGLCAPPSTVEPEPYCPPA